MNRLVIAALVLVIASRAHACPHFQLSSGTPQCAQCHVSPGGGGLLTPWGQDEFGDTIARGGDGRFLHGVVNLPAWLTIGGDVRLAALANDVGASDGTELAVFPMQADLAARIGAGAWSVVATVGARGAVRSGTPTSPPNDASMVSGPTLASYVVSREHYVMWHPDGKEIYARAGRFAAPYGLRLADHTAYVRRYLGYNLLEETYGASLGWLGDTVEAHATAFVSDPLQFSTRHEVGAAALVELHPETWLVVGASGRVGVASTETRAQGGAHGKVMIGSSLLLQGEVDGVREMFDGGASRWQLAAYTGPVWIPARGLYAGLAYEAFCEDLQVRGVTRHAGDVWVSLFPRAHFEVMLSGRAQRIGPSEHALLGMVQVHYTI